MPHMVHYGKCSITQKNSFILEYVQPPVEYGLALNLPGSAAAPN